MNGGFHYTNVYCRSSDGLWRKNIEDLIDKYADFLVKTQQQHRDEFYKLIIAYSLNDSIQ